MADIDRVIQLAEEAGEIVMNYYKSDYKIYNKSDGDGFDPVTAADLASDRHIRKRLQEEFPGDGILTEEAESNPDFSGRVWIADPIDGTERFIKKQPHFSVLIGLCVDGVPVLGVAHDPVRKSTYFAEKGNGAFKLENGRKKKIRVNDRDNLDDFRITSNTDFRRSLPLKKAETPEECDAVTDLAEGKNFVHVSYGYGKPSAGKWDYCAFQAILKEAGGKVTHLDGSPLDYKSPENRFREAIICSNGKVHDQLAQMVRKTVLQSGPQN